ncbi:MAG: hypothetical protein HYZ50_21270 [Deltaproteobacteria bacterium]|nr:hypothetical protein [Deltaproteobacteria bacterium]
MPPRQDGAKGLQAEYGDRLVCVRYRYDETTKRRWKTVELIVAEEPWTPPAPPPTLDQIVAVRAAALEKIVRQQVKNAGGQWGVWKLRCDRVVALGLSKQIVVASTF